MSKKQYVIRSEKHPGKFLAGLGIGSCAPMYPDVWTFSGSSAIHCTWEEAKAIITFVREGIDKDLGYSMYKEAHQIKEPWEEKGE